MKRFFALLLICMFAVALLASVPTAFAASANDIKLEVSQERNGDVLTVTVTLDENEGIVALVVRVDYDTEILTLKKRTMGPALSALSPLDNFESLDAFQAPYLISYATGSGKNDTTKGRLFTLTFDVAAGNSGAAVKVYICDLAYKDGTTTKKNEKYVTTDSYATGGYDVTEAEAAPDKIVPDKSSKALVIGLSVGGAAVVVIGTAIAFVLYKKKRK